MEDYLKLFEITSDYEEYIGGDDALLPNVSYCEDENKVHFNPYVETRLIVRYNVEDASNPTQLYMYMNQQPFIILGADMFSKVEIDETEVAIADLDTAQGQYQLSVGEHTVKYTLIDSTFIGMEADMETWVITRLGAIFSQCSNIISAEIPDSVTSIGGGAFQGCTNLTSITIPDAVTSIDNTAFGDCSSLTNVTIPNSVTSIGEYAFSSCNSLTSITIPDSVTSIGRNAFYGCSGLTNVTIGSGVTSIGQNAFENCSGLTSVNIPNNVTSIGNYAFSYCSSLTSITIPNSVTSIGENTFQNCTGLTSVTIGSGVTSINSEVFNGCTSLTSITIPNSVTSIGENTFSYCSNLANITSLAITAPTIQSTTFQNIKTNGTLTVPSGSTGYDVWMGTGNYYLGKYNWTKVEQ